MTISTINFSGLTLTPQFVNTTQLNVTIPGTAVAFAGFYPVAVANPAPGGGSSNSVTFTANNPVPVLTTLSPATVIPGTGDFLLTLTGANFVSTTTVSFDNQVLTPGFISSTQINVTIPGAKITTAHTATVTLFNPAPGGGISNILNLVVNTPPVADSGNNLAATVGKQITLDGRKSYDPDTGDRITFSWSIVSKPAGSTTSLMNMTSVRPALTPDVAGNYQVRLIVNDGKANSLPATVTITATAANSPPNADGGGDQSTLVNQLVTLDGRKSFDLDNDKISYQWNLLSSPVGSTTTVMDSTSVVPSLTPDLAGNYQVQLVVTDAYNNTGGAIVNITASSTNAAPMAKAGRDKNALTGSTITLDGTQSRDPNGNPLNYKWSFVSMPAGSTTTIANSTTATPTLTPDVSGEYLLRLVVNNGIFDSAPATILIVANAPNAGPNAVAGADQLIYQTDTVTLDGSASSDPNGDPLTYSWLMVSTPAGSNAAFSTTTAVKPTFVADVNGAYVARLTVSDGVNSSFADLVVVKTTALTSISILPVNPTIILGQTQAFSATGTFADGATKNLTGLVTWASADATVATISASGLATSLKAGTTLISASYGSIISPAQTLTVLNSAPTITGFTPTSGTVGTVVTITGTNFDTKVPGNNKVSFSGTSAIITGVTATTIITTVPLGASTGPITVTTLGGSATSAAPFTVIASQDFSIQAVPGSASVIQGKSVSYLMSLTSTGQSTVTNLVGLSATGLPTGVTAAFNPANISITQNSSIILTAGTTTTAGNYTVTVSGSASIGGQTVTRSATTQLSVIASGGTTLAGRILASKDDAPIQGAILTLGSQTATTDASGNFLLSSVPTGSQVLVVSGPTAIYPTLIPVPVTITSGAANDMPYPIYLQEVSTQYTSFTPGVATTINPPNIPDMSIYIPQGTYIIGADGQPNTKMSAVPVPIDRLPLPPVPNNIFTRTVYMFNFAKPGGGIPTVPIPIVYPNDLGGEPGDRADLWYYDESMTPNVNSNQWKIYGQGTVSQDGKTIVPDPGVGQPKFCCGASLAALRARLDRLYRFFAWWEPTVADPVDPSSGLYTINKTDMVLPGIVPISITRSYRTENIGVGSFGEGFTLNYESSLQPSGVLAMRYIMSNGEKYTFSQQPDGTYTNSSFPFLRGVVITRMADGTIQKRQRDGSLEIYNSTGLLTEQRDRNNNSIYITRDSYNRIIRVSDPAGRGINIGYSTTNGFIEAISDPLGRIVRYGYDSSNHLTSVTDPAGGVTTYTWELSNGSINFEDRITSVTDPKGITYVSNTYDSNGRVATQTLADGGTYTFAYTVVASNVTQTVVTDPMGNKTTYRFNSRQYDSSIVNALGEVTRYNRDFSTSLLNGTYDSLNRKTSFTNDLNGNVTSVLDPQGNPTLFEYEPVYNKVTKITDALNQTTMFTYDPNGNLISTIDPLGNKTTLTYNPQGQPVSVTDALNNTSQFVYDLYGNLITTIDPLGNQTQRTYDLVSRLISLTDANGKTVQYGYNTVNQVTQITDALGGKTSFSYDGNGNLLSITDAKGNTTANTYDVQDRLTTRKDPLLRLENFVYDLNGNLIKATDRKGQITAFSYDSLNRRITTTFADAYSISTVYDGGGRLVTLSDTASGQIQYVYDNLNRVISEATPLGQVSYSDDVLGRRTAMSVNGQTPVNYNYDANSRLASVGQGTQNVSLNYDQLGRRTSLVYPNGTQATYAYDSASRTTGISHQAGALNIENLTYTYDSAGNRISLNRASGVVNTLPSAVQAAYDAANQQTQFNSSAPNLTYDANGNLTSDGTKSYTWNARNQLVAIGGNVTASFSYDVVGRRIRKTINGVRTDYQYDGNDIIAEIGGGSAVNATYVRSFNIDEPFSRITSSGQEFYHTDALGSVFALTNVSGVTTALYTYDPFGNTTQTGISTNPFQYTGRENDGTGLYYYRARYYSPGLQRFITEDPIGFGGGINKYSYAGNGPLDRSDPFGLKYIIVPGVYPGGRGENDYQTYNNFGQGLSDATGESYSVIQWSGNPFNNSEVQSAWDQIAREIATTPPGEPVTIIGHSWGSVIAAQELAQGGQHVDLFVTMGSPLVIDAGNPNADDWLNIWSPFDPVSWPSTTTSPWADQVPTNDSHTGYWNDPTTLNAILNHRKRPPDTSGRK